VPEDLTADPDHTDYDRILADPRMEVRENRARPGHLLPACDVVGRGCAVPARRIVEVARTFGEQGVVRSICQDGFAGAARDHDAAGARDPAHGLRGPPISARPTWRPVAAG